MTRFMTLQDVYDFLRLVEHPVYDFSRRERLVGDATVGCQWRVDRDRMLPWQAWGLVAGHRSATWLADT